MVMNLLIPRNAGNLFLKDPAPWRQSIPKIEAKGIHSMVMWYEFYIPEISFTVPKQSQVLTEIQQESEKLRNCHSSDYSILEPEYLP
jgi:hypothetical protein